MSGVVLLEEEVTHRASVSTRSVCSGLVPGGPRPVSDPNRAHRKVHRRGADVSVSERLKPSETESKEVVASGEGWGRAMGCRAHPVRQLWHIRFECERGVVERVIHDDVHLKARPVWIEQARSDGSGRTQRLARRGFFNDDRERLHRHGLSRLGLRLARRLGARDGRIGTLQHSRRFWGRRGWYRLLWRTRSQCHRERHHRTVPDRRRCAQRLRRRVWSRRFFRRGRRQQVDERERIVRFSLGQCSQFPGRRPRTARSVGRHALGSMRGCPILLHQGRLARDRSRCLLSRARRYPAPAQAR